VKSTTTYWEWLNSKVIEGTVILYSLWIWSEDNGGDLEISVRKDPSLIGICGHRRRTGSGRGTTDSNSLWQRYLWPGGAEGIMEKNC